MFKFKILISCLLLFSLKCFSGDKVGNGGFVIKCDNQIELFDYFEAKQAGKKILPTIPGNTLEEKVESLFKRLETIDPNRAQNYRLAYITWQNTQQDVQVEGIHLDSTQAADPQLQAQFGLGKIAIPKNCELILALQQIPPLFSPKIQTPPPITIRVFHPVWDKLNPDVQASLVLHELFYREYILTSYRSEWNATTVRFLNSEIASDQFLKLNKSTWIDVLKSQNFIPMFPDYKGSDSYGLDIEYSPIFLSGEEIGRDYSFYEGWFNFIFYGKQKIFSDQVLDVQTYTPTFIYGIYPKQFYLNSPTDLELSDYSKFPLRINVSDKCQIKINSVQGPNSKNGIELSSIESTDKNPHCFLTKYENPNIKFSGAIEVSSLVKSKDNFYLNLIATEFSILQWFDGKVWKNIGEIQINLTTGKLIL